MGIRIGEEEIAKKGEEGDATVVRRPRCEKEEVEELGIRGRLDRSLMEAKMRMQW